MGRDTRSKTWSSTSRVSRRRMLSLSLLTGHTVQKYSIFNCSERWMKSGKLRRNGYQSITVNARMNHWTIWHRRNTDFTIIWPGSQKMHGTKTGLFTGEHLCNDNWAGRLPSSAYSDKVAYLSQNDRFSSPHSFQSNRDKQHQYFP